MSQKITINLLDHPDYEVKPGVRGEIVWHGQTYDTRKILPEVADRMAREPESKYVTFSDARIARDTEARLTALVAPAAAEQNAGEATATSTDTAAASTEDTTANAGGRSRNRRVAAPAGEAPGGEE